MAYVSSSHHDRRPRVQGLNLFLDVKHSMAVLTVECRLACGPIPRPLGNETVAWEHDYPGNEFGSAIVALCRVTHSQSWPVWE